jgi:hypothetical protein
LVPTQYFSKSRKQTSPTSTTPKQTKYRKCNKNQLKAITMPLITMENTGAIIL